MTPFFINNQIYATSSYKRAQQEKNSGIERSEAISLCRGEACLQSAVMCCLLALSITTHHIIANPVSLSRQLIPVCVTWGTKHYTNVNLV